LYGSLQQSLPPAPQINAFLASQQTAISQLGTAYCQQLVDTASLRDAFFTGANLGGSINATASSFFGTTASPTAGRTAVINAITAHAVGTGVNASYGTAVTNELNAMLDKIPALAPSTTVSTATKAACSAVLGSAVVSMK
jgi:hypothetical protein